MKRCLLFASLALLPAAAPAAEWAIEPSVEGRASMTDNINLTPGVHENTTGYSLSPRVKFARRTEATEMSGTAGLGFYRYPGHSDLDADNANLSFASKLNLERSQYGLTAAFVRDSTLQSELATTGIVQARRQRNLVNLAPSWNYSLTERSSVFAQYQYDQARYESGAGLENYTDQSASGGFQYLLSERTSLTLTGADSRYKTNSGSVRTNTYSLNAGLNYNASERVALGISAGGRRSDTTLTRTALLCPLGPLFLCQFFGVPLENVTASSKTTDNGLLLNLTANYRWDVSSANLVVGRDLNPSGTGLVVQTDRIAATISHQFNDLVSGRVSGAYLRSKYLGGLGSDTDYLALNTSLSWKLDEWWSVGGGYAYAYQKVKNAPESASSNTVFLSISYNWPKMSMSR